MQATMPSYNKYIKYSNLSPLPLWGGSYGGVVGDQSLGNWTILMLNKLFTTELHPLHLYANMAMFVMVLWFLIQGLST